MTSVSQTNSGRSTPECVTFHEAPTKPSSNAAVLVGIIIGLASLFFVGLTLSAGNGADVSRFGTLGNFLKDHATNMTVGAFGGIAVAATCIAFGRTMKKEVSERASTDFPGADEVRIHDDQEPDSPTPVYPFQYHQDVEPDSPTDL